jgi:glutamate 5-kinase
MHSEMPDGKHGLNLEREKLLGAARRIVVKVGTSTVTGANGELCEDSVKPIVESIARLRAAGRQVVLVSSGAIGLGRGWLGLHRSRLNDLVTKQACAAVGQSLLMNAYKDLFSSCGVKIAQVLLTEDDFSNWRRYSNVRRTMERLLEFGVLPIVNENDTVSTTELESVPSGTRKVAFSDNDRLAALVMSGLDADALVLLTNVDGFLKSGLHEPQGSPQDGVHPKIVSVVAEVTRDLKVLAAGPSSGGRGGMLTKLEAAEIAMNCGGTAIIANGQRRGILDRIFAGEDVGTTFLPSKRLRGKRRWIAYAADVRGRIVVDQGARQAIVGGKASLLRSGVVRIESHFACMDVVSILDDGGTEFARGIANCASQETADTPGKKRHAHAGPSQDASRILVRRDNIVLLETP